MNEHENSPLAEPSASRNRLLRVLVGLLMGLLGLPCLAILFWLFAREQLPAQDKFTIRQAPSAVERRTTSVAPGTAPVRSTTASRPVTETTYREESYTVYVPTMDPASGITSMRPETRTRKVPVHMTRMVSGPVHGREITDLVAELKSGKNVDATVRTEKLIGLKEKLSSDFDEMHQRQAEEIESAEQRLSELRSMHGKRAENKEQIVKRRIDQLLGRMNELDWQAPKVPSNFTFKGTRQESLPEPTYSKQNPSNFSRGNVQTSTRGDQSTDTRFALPTQDARSVGVSRPPAQLRPASVDPAAEFPTPITGVPIGLPSPPHIPQSASIWEAANNANETMGRLRSLESKFKAIEELKKQNAIPTFEYLEAKSNLEIAKSAAALSRKRMDSLSKTVELSLRRAKLQLDTARLEAASAKDGQATAIEIKEKQNAVLNAEMEVQSAEASYDLWKESMQILEVSKSTEERDEVDAPKSDPLDDVIDDVDEDPNESDEEFGGTS